MYNIFNPVCRFLLIRGSFGRITVLSTSVSTCLALYFSFIFKQAHLKGVCYTISFKKLIYADIVPRQKTTTTTYY